MLKEVWVRVNKWDRKLITTAIESGADVIACPDDMAEKIKKLGIIKVVCEKGDIIPDKDVFFFASGEFPDLDEMKKYLKQGVVCIDTNEWSIVELENIVALGGKTIVRVDNKEKLEIAMGVLEKGVSGVLLDTSDFDNPSQLKEAILEVKDKSDAMTLETACVTSIQQVGMGDRVCVDLATMLKDGEGLLVGNTSSFLFLVHGETLENPYVDPRPFRVNAGGVHAYVYMPEDKTKYLCELKAGDVTLVVSHEGDTRKAIVGRVKIERRPLILISAEVDSTEGSIILQNAETIRLVKPNGEAISIVQLKKGDEILVKRSEKARHFGMSIEETLWER